MYDAELLSGGVKKTTVEVSGSHESWLDRAIGYLSLGDYHSAAYAAREATQTEGNNARCWWVRSRANAGLNRWDDAIYEAQQAVSLEDLNAEYHFNLGCVAEDMRRWDQALQEFTRASNLDSSTPMYQLAVGGVYLQNDLPDKALSIIDAVYRNHPQDETTNYYLGMALIDSAEKVPRKQDGDSYAVTSVAEITRMRELATRARNLKLAPQEIRVSANHILDYLTKMEKMTFKMPGAFAGVAAAGFEGGLGTGCLGAGIAMMLFLLPVILIISGFSNIQGSGILFILLGGVLCYLWYKWTWVPTWKKNL